MGSVSAINPDESPLFSLTVPYQLPPTDTPNFSTRVLETLQSIMRPMPRTPCGEYKTSTCMSAISILELDEDDDQNDPMVAKIRKYKGFDFEPARWDEDEVEGTLLTYSLLKSTDSTTYTGHEFEYRNVPTTTWVEVTLGEEMFSVEVTSYGYEYMTNLREGESLPFDHDQGMLHYVSYLAQFPTSRMKYEDVRLTSPRDIATISHEHGQKEGECPGIWDDMLRYLKDNLLPTFASALER